MGTLEKKALKQYRRVCDSCQETFRPYKDITTCLNCSFIYCSFIWYYYAPYNRYKLEVLLLDKVFLLVLT